MPWDSQIPSRRRKIAPPALVRELPKLVQDLPGEPAYQTYRGGSNKPLKPIEAELAEARERLQRYEEHARFVAETKCDEPEDEESDAEGEQPTE